MCSSPAAALDLSWKMKEEGSLQWVQIKMFTSMLCSEFTPTGEVTDAGRQGGPRQPALLYVVRLFSICRPKTHAT